MTLAELRAKNLPRATLATMITVTEDPDGAAPTLIAEAQRYFDAFAPFQKTCISCDMPLVGLLGTFRWDLAHGEGACGNCRWPCRALHKIKTETCGTLTINNLVLQYHPDAVEG